MSEKENYFRKLSNLESSKLFLTDRVDLLKQEISCNCIRLALPPDGTSVDELARFLGRIKENRQEQLANSSLTVDLVYYLWFDELAGTLCINFINSNHSTLPFACALQTADSERRILECFLHSPYSSGVPLAELEEADHDVIEENPGFILEIFVEKLKKNLHADDSGNVFSRHKVV